MDKAEMIAILRGKVLHEPMEQIQGLLNEIADFLETSEHVIPCKECMFHFGDTGDGKTICSMFREIVSLEGYCYKGETIYTICVSGKKETRFYEDGRKEEVIL